MKIISRPRQGGKTTELLKIAHHQQGYIIVHSKNEAARLFQQAQEMGLNILFPVTYDELLEGKLAGIHGYSLFIDNLDMFLSRVSHGHDVEAITISPPIDTDIQM